MNKKFKKKKLLHGTEPFKTTQLSQQATQYLHHNLLHNPTVHCRVQKPENPVPYASYNMLFPYDEDHTLQAFHD